MSKSNGLIIYNGPSMIDGADIIVIATGLAAGSTNRKTGAMVQTYILRADVAPTDAIKAGLDASICGDCGHRGDGTGKARTCYVNVGQGPLAVWKAAQRGVYPSAIDADAITAAGAGRVVRLGTYGDPAAVPAIVWESLVAKAVAHTGYTHQWKASPAMRDLCMASADTEAEAAEAQAAGWRTFRVAMPGDAPRVRGEARCPASAEAEAITGMRLTCEACRACSGAGTGRRASIVIQAHGGFAVMANVKRRAAARFDEVADALAEFRVEARSDEARRAAEA